MGVPRKGRGETPTPPTLGEIRSWPATVDIPTACTAFGISTSYGYELVKSGSFPARTLTLGTVSRVVTASIVALLSEESAA